MVVDVEPLKVAVSPSVGEIYAVAKISFNFFRSINGPWKDQRYITVKLSAQTT